MTGTGSMMLPVRNPRTGLVDCSLAVDTGMAVRAKAVRLRKGQRHWGAMSLDRRVDVMRRWLEEITARAEDIARLDAVDTGGCRTSFAQGFVTMANVRGWIEDAEMALQRAEFHGPSHVMPEVEIRTQLVPYPLVGVISPWNAPIMLALLDAVPALFAGSAVLLKPSEITPRVLEPLFATVAAVPELAEVFDYAIGDGATGQHVIEAVDLVCFTGSVPTGRKVAVACAERLIPCFLELGGNDPAIVTASADLDRAASAVLRGGVFATGQVCFSTERVYVHADIHDRFVDVLVQKAGAVRFNVVDPRCGEIGPFIFAPQASIVERHVRDAVDKGARLLSGRVVETHGGGLYMAPTILVDVTHEMLVMRAETFGPVLPVMRYSSIEEAIALANDTTFGLTASVIAGNEAEALPIARGINAGAVFIQDTFLTLAKSRTIGTNSFGQSGLGGSRTGPESILRFVRRKALMTNHGPAPEIGDTGQSPMRAAVRVEDRGPRAEGDMLITAAVSRPGKPTPLLERVVLGDPLADELLVRIVATGICQTDLHAHEGRLPPLPIVLGHEGAGIVEARGVAVTDFSVGDHVVLSGASCGACPNCQQCRLSYCDTVMPRSFGGSRLDGSTALRCGDKQLHSHFFGQSSFATHAVVPARTVICVSDDQPIEKLAAHACGVITGAGTVIKSLRVGIDDTIAIFGVGGVGLSAVMAAHLVGARRIVAIDIDRQRLALARELGATDILAADDADLLDKIKAISGRGVDYSFNTTTVPEVFTLAMECLAMRGTAAFASAPRGPWVPEMSAMLAGGRKLRGVLGGDVVPRQFIPMLIEHWQHGRFPFDRLLSFYPFSDIARAYDDLCHGRVIKPVLMMAGAG